MTDKQITVYISENSSSCQKLTDKMDQWGVNYMIKNITQNIDTKRELQNFGIYGTPATFIEGYSDPVLGCQIEKLKSRLNIDEADWR